VALDERLRRELDRAAQPADPSGIYEHLIRRRERRQIVRKVQSGLLTVVVLLGSVGGFYALTRIFRETEEPPPVAAPTVSNGVIVFSRDIAGEGEHLFVATADGSDVRQLTPDGRAVYRSADVSPDGRTIVVAHEIPGFDPGQSVLATVPIEGGSPTWLTQERWLVLDPTWSPDGGRIAFAGSPGGPFGIYVFDLETSDVRLVPGTDGISVGHPTWSPDGTRIGFEGSTGGGQDPAPWDIYAVAVDGSGMTNLTNTPDVSESQPAWSWALNRIAFVEIGPAESALRTMSPTGSDTKTAYSGELAPANPVWAPDGAAIAFEAGSEGIFTIGSDGAHFVVPNLHGTEPAWQPLPEGQEVSPQPSPSPTPRESPATEGVQDIGLGFPVCNVYRVTGVFAPGVSGTAFVATKSGDIACPELGDGDQVLAIDVSGDGLADVSYGPLQCDDWCTPFAAPDVDGDGTDELLIQNIQFSIAGLRLYEVRADPAEVLPVTVATPGYPEGGLDPGAEPQFWLGGDGFDLDELQCASDSGRRVLLQTSASMVPPDTPDSVWSATETAFALNPDGTLSVVRTQMFEEPVVQGGPSFWDPDDGLCGTRLPYPYGGG
jgi:Tol biopolymer transport system component